MSFTRREFVVGSAALAGGATVTAPLLLPKYHSDQRSKRSRVAILHAQQYSQQLDQIVLAGLRLFPIDVRGKTVVLKPNLVDYIPGNAINTHPLLVLAAAESFRRLGAKSVWVAEGPGHQRDTQLVLSQSGYAQALRDEKIQIRGSQSRPTDSNPTASELHGDERPLAPSHGAGRAFPGFHAEDQDPSLVWRHAQHEEPVWRSAGCDDTDGRRISCTGRAFRKASSTYAPPFRSTSSSRTASWRWKETGHSTARLVPWGRSCSPTIQWLPMRPVRD